MNEFLKAYEAEPYLIITSMLYALWLGSLIVTELFRRAVAWIDDSKVEGANPINKLVAKAFNVDTYWYPELLVLYPVFSILILATAIHFYWLGIGVASTIATSYIARATRRLQKNLAKHMADKGAHK